MKHLFLSLAASVAMLFSCDNKPEPGPEPGPTGPTTISLSGSSFNVAQAGETLSLQITAPARPKLDGIPSWITYRDGTFKDYAMTVGLVVAANDTYESRTVQLTVSAGSAPSQTVTVTQAGKEPEPTPPDPTPGSNDAWQLARRLGLGWNMGNQFDGFYNGSWAGDMEGYPSEAAWQNEAAKATQTTFDNLKKAGFTTVRIPVSWLKMIGAAPSYTINETWLNRVYEVVGYAHNAGLTVIVNTHHDENHGVNNDYQWLDIKNAVSNPTLNAQIKDKIRAVWTQIANKFNDCGDWLILESFNEINDGGWGWSREFLADPTRQCNILNDWNQVFVDAVRATGGNNATRWLGVPTYAANPEYEKYAKLPTDPAGKLMLAVHFYDPSGYTIGDEQWSDWGHTGEKGKKADGGDEDHVRAVFSNLCTKYVDRNIPVYLGEFGCSMRAKSNTRAWKFYLYYLEYVVKAAKTYGLPCYLWDNGVEGDGKEKHGYIHHGNGNYIGNSKEVIEVLKKAWFTAADGYTLETVYNSAPKI